MRRTLTAIGSAGLLTCAVLALFAWRAVGGGSAHPARIVPDWYALPFYAILRAVPDKLGGLLAGV